jgi:hypothetical protein
MANIKASVNNWGCVKWSLKKYLNLSNQQIDRIFNFIKTDLPDKDDQQKENSIAEGSEVQQSNESINN